MSRPIFHLRFLDPYVDEDRFFPEFHPSAQGRFLHDLRVNVLCMSKEEASAILNLGVVQINMIEDGRAEFHDHDTARFAFRRLIVDSLDVQRKSAVDRSR